MVAPRYFINVFKLDLDVYLPQDPGKIQFGCEWNTCFAGYLLENYWEKVSPLFCLETSAVQTCVPFMRLDKGSSLLYFELKGKGMELVPNGTLSSLN